MDENVTVGCDAEQIAETVGLTRGDLRDVPAPAPTPVPRKDRRTPGARTSKGPDPRPGITVDGPRPAVTWVTSLPWAWGVTSGQRLVLLALAVDAYGWESAPGMPALAAWTGMYQSSVEEIITELCTPRDHRPALLVRVYSTRGGRRTTYRLAPGCPGGDPPGNHPGSPLLSEETIRLIKDEAERAHLKHGAHSMLGSECTDMNRFTALVEEVGEVAQELTYNHNRQGLLEELIQVSAVAATWVERLMR